MGAAADVKADLAKAYPKGAPHDDVVLTNDYQEQQSGSDKAGDKTINYQASAAEAFSKLSRMLRQHFPY